MKRNDPRHGTENGYGNLACRCKRCTKAHAEYFRTGSGHGRIQRYRIESGLLKTRYRQAREAGYDSYEARRRAQWADPLRKESAA